MAWKDKGSEWRFSRPRVPQPEDPRTGSRSRGGGNTHCDDAASVEPALEPAALHGTVRNNRTKLTRRAYVSVSTGTVRI
jgi:hypothetical protein